MPGTRCTVAVCKNSHAKTKNGPVIISYHKFPNDPQLRKEWIHRCRRAGEWNPNSCHVCSIHFKRDDFEMDVKNLVLGLPQRNILKENAVPSQHLGLTLLQESDSSERAKRMEARHKKSFINEVLLEKDEPVLNVPSTTDPQNFATNNDTDTNLQAAVDETRNENNNQLDALREKIQKLEAENDQLQQQITSQKILARSRIKRLQNQNQYLKSKKHSEKELNLKIKQVLSSVLTPNQLDIILGKKKRVNWTTEEISAAFTLRYFSKRSYIYMRSTLHYPLPGLSTLQAYASKINMRQGLLNDVFKFMEIAGREMTPGEKLVVIQFDEVKVHETYEYDRVNDEVVGPHSQLQAIMARGLIGKWKQPIYLDFDKKMTSEILDSVLKKLHSIGYEVVACVSDCGGGNIGLWRDLNVTIEQSWFLHPITNNRVYFFADAPHLLKLIRNWLLDTGFILEDGTIVNKEPLIALIKLTGHEVSVCHKLNETHIACRDSRRQNVSLASQLLSHSTATALKHYHPGVDKELAVNTGDFIELVNSWFDVMNSYRPVVPLFPSKSGFGMNLEAQTDILNRMFQTIHSMHCIGKKSLQTFQKGLLMSINSLKALREDLKVRYDITYILTHKLNQDSLENFFSQLRTRGGLDDHPTPMNALFRIRMVILGKNPGIVQSNTNTVDVAPDEYVVAKVLQQASISVPDPEPETEVFEVLDGFSTSSLTSSDLSDRSNNNDQQGSRNSNYLEGETAGDAINYLAGWVARKYRDTYPNLGDYSYVRIADHNYALPSWTQHLSYGGLTVPSAEWATSALKFEKFFKKHHSGSGDSVCLQKGKGVVAKLVKRIMRRTTLPEPVVETFIRQRTFIRMNYLNYKIKEQKTLKRKSVVANRENEIRMRIRNKQRKIME